VRFWDTSALVPLLVDEPGTELALGWLREDPDLVVWGLARLEMAASIERAAREGRFPPALRQATLARAERIAADAHEVTDLAAVRVRAVPLLGRHPLRAADAAQLGAALLVADPDPRSLAMVVLDRRLAEAAQREGLQVLSWPAG
jgi:hypothetical protein